MIYKIHKHQAVRCKVDHTHNMSSLSCFVPNIVGGIDSQTNKQKKKKIKSSHRSIFNTLSIFGSVVFVDKVRLTRHSSSLTQTHSIFSDLQP